MSGRHLSIGVLLAGLALGAGVTSATYAERANRSSGHKAVAPHPAQAVVNGRNPLLPPAVAVGSFSPDLGLIQKVPTIAPAGFEPLYTAEDWNEYRQRYGEEADGLKGKKSSVVAEFSRNLIEAAETEKTRWPGVAAGSGSANSRRRV